MFHAPTLPAPRGATEKRAPSRTLFARLVPHATVLLTVIGVALIWADATANTTRERARDEQAAIQSAGNLARAFEAQVIGLLRAADQVLLYVRGNVERNAGQIDPSLWSRPFDALSDFSFQIAVIGRDGTLAASNIESPDTVLLRDREHFLVHAGRASDELYISKPLIGRVSGRQSIQLTRRISAPDGSFAGVMVLSIDPDYFTRFYKTIDLGKNGSVSLVGTDGFVRAHGVNERVENGQSVAGGRLLTEFARAPSGSFVTRSRSDGIERFVNYRAVNGYPLIVSVDSAVDEVLADYYRTRLLRIIAASVLTLILVPLMLLIVRYERGLARARDAAEAATRARSEFLAVMSHEIRTPMNAVLGFASTLLESKLDTEQRLNATALHAAGDDLLRLLNDILDFSRLDAGRIQFEDIPFSPAGLVETTSSIARRSATAKGLMLRIDIDPELPPALRGDSGRLRQVLLNLLTNAIKFTNRGEIVVEARRLSGTATHATVQWSVTDSGIGIAPDRIGGMFTDFVQADSSVNRRFGGSGLGLAICKRISDQMGGWIGARSIVGRGSTFTFRVTLPITELVIEAEGIAGSAITDLKTHIASLGRPLRILLAEDNPTNQLVGKQLLREFDANVSVASNGLEAAQSAGDFSYDVILMDMQMPEMNGIEATRAIRARGGVHAQVPIVALTANAFPEDVKACLDAGMNGFVAKPVHKCALAEAILRSLTDASAARPQALNNTGHSDDAAEAAIIDPTAVDEFIAQVGCDSTDEIVTVFLSETERRLGILRGLPVDDHDAIRREAHTLKGSSGTFGLMRLSTLSRKLERDASVIAPDDYRVALDSLDDVFTRSRHELNIHLRKTCANHAELAE